MLDTERRAGGIVLHDGDLRGYALRGNRLADGLLEHIFVAHIAHVFKHAEGDIAAARALVIHVDAAVVADFHADIPVFQLPGNSRMV